MKKFINHWRSDLPSSLVVFLVALPLCLGVGLASTNIEGMEGAAGVIGMESMPKVFAGIIAGIVGGIIVGFLSGSRIGVSGPAAGLITIVLAAIITLGSFEAFLLAVVISGVLQVVAGFTGLGIIADYFPSSVIKGMLAAIGITLILKELPHLVGYDKDFFGDESFNQFDGHNTFSEIAYAMGSINLGATTIGLVSVIILLLFDRKWLKQMSFTKIIPAALVVVATGIALNALFKVAIPSWYVGDLHLVNLPQASSISEFIGFFSFPDFSALTNPKVYIVALTIALVGSLETLLSVEATDKLDPEKNVTPTNRELKAQGVGNILSGLLGGLPITQVIVRSSANAGAGAKTKYSTIIHGVLLLLTVVFIPSILNLIPLASLAGILIMVGYKLAKVQLFKHQFKLGWEQFVPFTITVVGVLFTDLLKGIGFGILAASYFILRNNFQNNFKKSKKEDEGNSTITIVLSQEISFLNKAGIMKALREIPNNTKLIIDGSKNESIDYDVLEVIHEFNTFGSKERNIHCLLIDIPKFTSN